MKRLVNLSLGRPISYNTISRQTDNRKFQNDTEISTENHVNVDNSWIVDLGKNFNVERFELYSSENIDENNQFFDIFGSVDCINWLILSNIIDDKLFRLGKNLLCACELLQPNSTRFVKFFQVSGKYFPIDECRVLGLHDDILFLPVNSETKETPIFERQATPNFVETFDIVNFGCNCKNESIVIFPKIYPPPQIPMISNIIPHRFVAEDHYNYPTPPEVKAYAVSGANIFDVGVVILNSEYVLLEDCMPPYFNWGKSGEIHPDLPIIKSEQWKNVEEIVSSRPVSCPIHKNMVYGHFLIEMLPRMYTLSILKQMGCDFAVAIPTDIPNYIKEYARLFFKEDDIIWYNSKLNFISAPSIIISSMMHTNYNFHPAFNLMVADLRARNGLDPIPSNPRCTQKGQHRIYLSRQRYNLHKRLENEEEVVSLIKRLGISVIHPQEMTIKEQLEVFDGATLVISEYTSAIHNTIFSRPGTSVVSLDYNNWYQSMIGQIRQQPLGFVSPNDNEFRHWRLPGVRKFTINLEDLERMIMIMAPEISSELNSKL